MSGTETIVGLGAKTDFVGAVPNVDPTRLRLTADEGAVFAIVGRATQIQEVITRSGLSEPKAIAVLLALRAKGAIVPARVQQNKAAAEPLNAAMNEDVELDAVRKKEILDLEKVLESANHFEVLGLRPGTAPDEVKKAFYEASRRYHPDRYFGKNLGSFRARIERVFKRLSEAHTILTDEARREKYLRANPHLVATPEPQEARPRSAVEEARDAERRARFAKHPYLAKASRITELVTRGKAHIAKGEYGHAYTDLHMASQIEPRNMEVQELLNETRRKHEAQRAGDEMKKGDDAEAGGDLASAVSAWRSASLLDPNNAKVAYKAARGMMRQRVDAKEIKPFAQRAVDAEPKNADYRVLLGSVLLEAGMKALAQRQFEEALKLDPNHAEAKKHIKKWWQL